MALIFLYIYTLSVQRSMNIAVNTRFLIPGKMEGIGAFTFDVFSRISAWHPEHQFYFLFDRAPSPTWQFGSNVHCIHVPPQARHPVLFYLWFEWSIPLILKRYKIDLFVSPDAFGSLRTSVPTHLTIHDLAFKHLPQGIPKLHLMHYNYYVERYAQKANRIATVSEYSKKDINLQYGIPLDKIDVVWSGAHSRFRPLDDELERAEIQKKYTNGAPYFVYVGSVHPRKNVAKLVEAFDLYKKRHPSSPMKLVLVGRMAWDFSEVEQVFAKITCKDDVIRLGYQPEDEVVRLIGAAYALTYVSIFEGFGLPIHEAFCCHTPAIYSQLTSMPEVGADAGLPVDPNNVQQIADAMHLLWTDKDLYEVLCQRAIERKSFFSADKTAQLMWQSLLKTMV
jgi:glycosyltransferase involved in cell wall biosynthesis